MESTLKWDEQFLEMDPLIADENFHQLIQVTRFHFFSLPFFFARNKQRLSIGDRYVIFRSV